MEKNIPYKDKYPDKADLAKLAEREVEPTSFGAPVVPHRVPGARPDGMAGPPPNSMEAAVDTYMEAAVDTYMRQATERRAEAELDGPTPPVEMGAKVMKEALDIINGDRQADYGGPEDSFNAIASFWSAYLWHTAGVDYEITAKDVARMMALMKMARLTNHPGHRDSYVDVIGYMGIAAHMEGID